MRIVPLLAAAFLLLAACKKQKNTTEKHYYFSKSENCVPLSTLYPAPPATSILEAEEGSFGDWLAGLPVDTTHRVLHYYTGDVALQQNGHAGIIDIPVKNNVQDSRKLIMRIYAEYLYQQGRYDELQFSNAKGEIINPKIWFSGKHPGEPFRFPYSDFRKYLNETLAAAGWKSWMKQLKRISRFEARAGDIVYQKSGGGSHAMLIAAAAIGRNGQRYHLYIEGATPPAEMHVVANNEQEVLSPWYPMIDGVPVRTPYWVFNDKNYYRLSSGTSE